MVDSGVRNPGEVEYDKQNCLQHQKTLVWPEILILLAFTIVQLTIAIVRKFVSNKKVSN